MVNGAWQEKPMHKPSRPFVLLLGVVLFAAACTSAPTKVSPTATPPSNRPVIKLAVLPWLAAELDVRIAQRLLEHELGYPVELIPVVPASQFDELAAGNIHASLELWTTSYPAQIEQYIHRDGAVENGGPLGVVGHSGLFVPDYVLLKYPMLRSWESLKDPQIVAAFAASSPPDRGRIIGGDPDWIDQKHGVLAVKNLGLNFDVDFTGSEAAEVAALTVAYEAHESFLAFFWTPHWILGIYDLYRVALPPYSEDCYAVEAQIACDFPEDRLLKIFWPGLAEYAPDAYQFLKRFTLTNNDQIQMMAQVQADHATVDQVVQQWIEENQAVWQAWLP